MKPGNRIAVVIPWFGPWPGWIEYFFHSCSGNPSVEWIFPTDAPVPRDKAKNLTFVPYTLQNFNREAGRILNLDLNLRFPYKICDFKPAYGQIFYDLIRDHDYWAYGDLDLVYGNIEEFITDSLLDNYDIISNHKDFVAGHFCLLKNTRTVRELFRLGETYRIALTRKYYTGFDEQYKPFGINPDPGRLYRQQKLDRNVHQFRYRLIHGMKKVLPGGIRLPLPENSGRNLPDFSAIVKHAERKSLVKVSYRKTFESDLMLAKRGIKNWEITWRDGSLLNKEGQRLLYFHFIRSKGKDSFRISPFKRGSHEFRISPLGISC